MTIEQAKQKAIDGGFEIHNLVEELKKNGAIK